MAQCLGSPSPRFGERGLGGEGLCRRRTARRGQGNYPSPPDPLSPKRGEGEKERGIAPLSPKRGEGGKDRVTDPLSPKRGGGGKEF